MIDISPYNWLENIFNKINFENLPHGLVINGPKGMGKTLLSYKISSNLLLNKSTKIFDKELFFSKTHPDFFILNKEKVLLRHITFRKNTKKDEWDEELGERNINDFLSGTPSISINKVALILNAHTMNKEAQNALLKTLEEPSPNSFIIIVTDRSNALFDTIYSRCQTINVAPLSNTDLNSWLSAQGITDYSAHDFPSYFTPLSILNAIENDQQNDFKNFIDILSNFFVNKIDQNLVIKNLNNLNLDLITKLNYLIEFLKILLKSKLLSETLSGNYSKIKNAQFNNLKISNLINDINNFRIEYYKVPQINEGHLLNYVFSELKNSIKIS